MNNVERNQQLIGLTVGASCAFAALGAIGGTTLHAIVEGTSPLAHTLVFGGMPLASVLLFKILDKRVNNLASVTLAIFGGYFSSWALTNLAGHEIAFLAPFVGVATFIGTSAAVVAVIGVPLLIGLCIVKCR